MRVVIAKFTARPGQRDEAIRRFGAFVDLARTEQGVDGYALLTDDAEPDALWLVERYADEASFDAHVANLDRLGLRSVLDDVRGEPTVAFATTLVGGYLASDETATTSPTAEETDD